MENQYYSSMLQYFSSIFFTWTTTDISVDKSFSHYQPIVIG